ncbi:flagellar export chaperone FliS [Nocardioides sp. MAH-18]|uniref:Flagellar export chaperone FliS n=1 Tax=Nocardioides agri TaxID=2682843 RepID=A0A6L6XVD6_9ACTN|nr:MULTISPECIES: flagellar export chaperone FliS [unclassified Nocardioides]MBA2955787.1 flagellar export chaperone FliS [Nocardioides sp. CGMCC 1.13656]MVQ50637.1 flagellar export chaperone FliS [Nocardioides sp. MAH-18]
MTTMNPRDTYLQASVSTATPSQLLVMLYERLVLDVERAVDALRRGEPSQAHAPLLHAQEIVLELNASLKVDAWGGAAGLASLYSYVHGELVTANMRKDLKVAEFCLHVVSTLRDTWREAALSLLAQPA